MSLLKALKWVGGSDCQADIIVMSLGFHHRPERDFPSLIDELVGDGKLIFAAASNSGGNKPRAYPAKEVGVFCIHVSDGKGNKGRHNPAPVDGDNFSTLGVAIDSKYNGKDSYIDGSSFATPIAAAIAANALEYIRHTLTDTKDNPDYFYHYQGMRNLFRCLSDSIDGYDYVKPWKRYLWDRETSVEETRSALRYIRKYGYDRWARTTSEDAFPGFHPQADT
jgi:hypothetical protein